MEAAIHWPVKVELKEYAYFCTIDFHQDDHNKMVIFLKIDPSKDPERFADLKAAVEDLACIINPPAPKPAEEPANDEAVF